MELNEQQKKELNDLGQLVNRLHPDAKYNFIQNASNINDYVRLSLFEVHGYYKAAEEFATKKHLGEAQFYQTLNKYYYLQKKEEE